MTRLRNRLVGTYRGGSTAEPNSRLYCRAKSLEPRHSAGNLLPIAVWASPSQPTEALGDPKSVPNPVESRIFFAPAGHYLSECYISRHSGPFAG